MKFFAEPNLFVRVSNKPLQRAVGVKGFSFDGNGEFITENETLIKVLKTQFKFDEVNLPSDDKTDALDGQEIASETTEEISEVEEVTESEEVVEEVKPKRRGR